MNPYDKEKTREIWKRVLHEEETCDCRAFDSEQLREMIAAGKSDACTYRAMGYCADGRCRDQLCCFAKDAAAAAKKLETVFFLWTGECACVPSGKAEKVCCLADSLRQMYRMETDSAAKLRRTAEELPDYAAVFFALAEEKTCRAKRIMKLLSYDV